MENEQYVVIFDQGANKMWMEETWEGKHFGYHGPSFSGNYEDCEMYIDECEKDSINYVVYSNDYGYLWVEKEGINIENNLPQYCYKEFESRSEEEAYDWLKEHQFGTTF